MPTCFGTRVYAHRLALGLAVLALLPPEHVLPVAVDLHRVRRVGGLIRRYEYAPSLTTIAAAVHDRCEVGIVLLDNASGVAERLLPVVVAAAMRVRTASAWCECGVFKEDRRRLLGV